MSYTQIKMISKSVSPYISVSRWVYRHIPLLPYLSAFLHLKTYKKLFAKPFMHFLVVFCLEIISFAFLVPISIIWPGTGAWIRSHKQPLVMFWPISIALISMVDYIGILKSGILSLHKPTKICDSKMLADRFKEAFAQQDVGVHFIGAWWVLLLGPALLVSLPDGSNRLFLSGILYLPLASFVVKHSR